MTKHKLLEESVMKFSTIILLAMLPACKTTNNSVVQINNSEMDIYSSEDSYSMIAPDQDFLDSSIKAELTDRSDKSWNEARENNRAQLLIAKGELEQAESLCMTILMKNHRNVEAKISMAQIALKKGEFEQSRIILHSLDALKKKDSRILNLLGMIAVNQQKYPLALAMFKEGLVVNPEDLAIRMNLGVLYLTYRQLNQAAVQFERILRRIPNHSDAEIHLAVVDISRGNTEKAKTTLQKYIGSKESNALANYNYATILDQEEKYEDALKTIQTFLEHAPKDAERIQSGFKLADKIQRRQEAAGQKMDNSEIQTLAEKFQAEEQQQKEAKLSAKPLEKQSAPEDEPNTAATPKAGPVAAPKATPANYELEEIDQLEKSLQ
jgi:tetratricopeptide (TPR) repeat protein